MDKIIKNDQNDVPVKRTKNNIEERDTSGDTKVFQIIKKEDIEKEKRRQALKKENLEKNNLKTEVPSYIKSQVNVDKVIEKSNLNELPEKDNPIIQKQIGKNSNKNKISNNIDKKINNIQNNKPVNNIQKNKANITQSNNLQNTNQKEIVKKAENIVKPETKNNQINKTQVNLNENKAQQNQKKYNNYQDNNKNTNKKNNKKGLLITLLIIIFILIFLIIGSTIFGLINMNSDKIVKGVKINNTDLSNLTKEQAVQLLESNFNNSENNIITIKHGDYTSQINVGEIGGSFDVQTAVNLAYNIGRESDIVHNNFKTLETMFKGENIQLNSSYNDELMEKKSDEISIELPDLATDSSYVISENKLIIKNSKDGIKIQKEKFKQDVINAFGSTQKEIELPVEKAERNIIDIDAIHDEIYKEPVNAYYTTNPYKVFKEEDGLDFAISVDQAKQMLLEDKPEYEIELKTLKPQITVESLNDEAFPNILGTFTTTYGTADTGRNTNIAIAAKSINSAVVMPGEVFSYNDLIGECSTRTGYQTSTIYLNGQLSTGVGGGICQVSTTLYNAVLRANLEIVQRRNHSLEVTYVPAGQDAMVNIGTSDFKFKNNRDYPVKVVAFVGPGSITCQIKGLSLPTEYEVKLESKTIEKTETRKKVETYKVLYLNGREVSRTWLSTDTYKMHQ